MPDNDEKVSEALGDLTKGDSDRPSFQSVTHTKSEKETLKKVRKLAARDVDQPSLWSFFLLESFKWGFLCLAVYIALSITYEYISPPINSVIEFFSE